MKGSKNRTLLYTAMVLFRLPVSVLHMGQLMGQLMGQHSLV